MSASENPRLFSPQTQAIWYNVKLTSIQRQLDFDALCDRPTPSVAALVSPGAAPGEFQKVFFGNTETALPVFSTIGAACEAHPKADVFINYASYRSAFESSMVALKQKTIRILAIIAEGIPERNTKELIASAKKLGKIIIGPATVGAIGCGFKIGDTAGTLENIMNCKLYRPGCVGFVSKSGGMSNEMFNVLSRTTDGIYEGVAVGGDAYPGTTLADHVLRYQQIPEIKMIVVLGELGGVDEYGIVQAIKEKRVTKPVVAWVTGTCAKYFNSSEVQFGHAGAKSGVSDESAEAKNQALAAVGAFVPSSFEGFADCIASVHQHLLASGAHVPAPEVEPKKLPTDLSSALKTGSVRKPTSVVCTISDDRGEEPTYLGIQISEIAGQGYSIGDVISLLWFKKLLPRWGSKFLEMCIIMAADHGPCVATAHNTIVAARAGKDLVSSLCSGLLTIGPRHGGAIDQAAIDFKTACDAGLRPDEFVESHKAKGLRVDGIGHRIKTKENRDKRVLLLSRFARQHFPGTRYLEYAEAVETYTLSKAANLVLNIDGCIGATFCDLLATCGCFERHEVDKILELGVLNGIFVLSRSIGMIGHALDQKRMSQPLYRMDAADVLYLQPESKPTRPEDRVELS